MAIQPTQTSPTFQQSSRGYAIDHIVLHHCATTDFDGVVSMMTSGSRQVSANYVVKDNRIAAVVPENMRSWSLSSALWDGRSVTFEIANAAVTPDWPVSAASHETVAHMVADICGRYGIPINRDRILGHREVYSRYGASYATACPGGLDLDLIVARAAQIASGETIEPEIESEPDMGNLYYASGPAVTKDGVTVNSDTMWWQRTTGGPIFALTDNKAYKGTAGELEFLAIAIDAEGNNKPGANYRGVTTEQMRVLIKARGITASPEAPTGTVNVGDINIPQTEVIAALKANTIVLERLVQHLGA